MNQIPSQEPVALDTEMFSVEVIDKNTIDTSNVIEVAGIERFYGDATDVSEIHTMFSKNIEFNPVDTIVEPVAEVVHISRWDRAKSFAKAAGYASGLGIVAAACAGGADSPIEAAMPEPTPAVVEIEPEPTAAPTPEIVAEEVETVTLGISDTCGPAAEQAGIITEADKDDAEAIELTDSQGELVDGIRVTVPAAQAKLQDGQELESEDGDMCEVDLIPDEEPTAVAVEGDGTNTVNVTITPTAVPEVEPTPEPTPYATLTDGTEVWIKGVETGQLIDPDTGDLIEGVWGNNSGNVSSRIYDRCSDERNLVGQVDGNEVCGTPVLGTESGCMGVGGPVELDYAILSDFIVPGGPFKGEPRTIVDKYICVFPNDTPRP